MHLEKLFMYLLNMSITAGYVAIAVIILRLLLKKAPRWVSCALWALVGLRLILPFSFKSVVSLIPRSGTITPDILYSAAPAVSAAGGSIPAASGAMNPVISGIPAPAAAAAAAPMQTVMSIAGIVWLVGIFAMLLYSAVTYGKLRRNVSSAVLCRDNIYESDAISSPFVLGIVKPRIYMPFTVGEMDSEYVISHEQAHIRRKDHWIKPFGFLLLTVYWFNPLIWVAYILLCRDIEVACDEAVIKDIGGSEKKAYSLALLNCAVKRRSIAMCPLAFGEVGIKERVKNVLNYKKPTFWIIIIAVIACIVAAACLLSNPKDKNDTTYEHPNAEQLFEYRTAYVGDNSAVANIVYLLNFPSDVTYDHIELQTSSEPYGVDVYFSVTPEIKTAYDTPEPENIKAFRINACIMFSLIENADEITFRLNDGKGDPVDLNFTREWAGNVVGAGLWEESSSAEKLDSLITRITEHVEGTYASTDESIPTSTSAPAVIQENFLAGQYYCSVTLPEDWEGLYTVYQGAHGILFYDEANSDYGGKLFAIYWLTDDEAEDPWEHGIGNDGCKLIRQTDGGGFYAVYPYTDVEYNYEDETKTAEYKSLLEDMDGICDTLTYGTSEETAAYSLPSTENLPRGYDANAAPDGTLYSYGNDDDGLVSKGYIGWIDDPTGWLVLKGDIAAGSEDAYVYLTYDGGKNWTEIGNANSVHRMDVTGAGFASEKVGFISYRYYTDSGPDIWRTMDGGNTWESMPVDIPDYLQEYNMIPLSPTFTGGSGICPVELYDHAAYLGTAYLATEDGGMTWQWTESVWDKAVKWILFKESKTGYQEGECTGEGHIILGYDEASGVTKVYALTMSGQYGFEDGNFVKVSGTGIIPAVFTFKDSNAGIPCPNIRLTCTDIEYPEDGSGYGDSIKKMFPAEYQDRALNPSDSDMQELTAQERLYAASYLKGIGRDAVIGDYRDFEHPLLTDAGVSVDVSNSIVGNSSLADYPMWIGSREALKDGVRYVYEMSYNKDAQEIDFKKYEYDTNEVVELTRMNSITGEIIETTN